MTTVIGPLSDEFLLALGRVTANFTLLELQISFLLGVLISKDTSLGQIVTAELSFKALTALLSSVFRYHVENEELREELEALLNRAHGVEERRNKVVHSSGCLLDLGGELLQCGSPDIEPPLEAGGIEGTLDYEGVGRWSPNPRRRSSASAAADSSLYSTRIMCISCSAFIILAVTGT